ncbi:DUF5672 family protein [Sphingobium tyrosinilyticum]|uniref:DUF5672 family protein n=1 Tax=Sphingobium tyrosinilyticum TaxID=2715436 RepID=UPI0036D3CB62
MAQIDFAACKLFTDAPIKPENSAISVVPITRLGSSAAYSEFLLSQMVDHVVTSHCLVAQWDGHVLDAARWRPEFLDYDYIGATWPQFDDGHDVGNGGFSLRSRRLMEACRDPQFKAVHPEDIAIGRTNRSWLEGRGMRFAPPELADLFATERGGDLQTSFGYHGVWNMPRAIGVEAFWRVFRELDDRATVSHDFSSILNDVRHGRSGQLRMVRMIANHIKYRLGRAKGDSLTSESSDRKA